MLLVMVRDRRFCVTWAKVRGRGARGAGQSRHEVVRPSKVRRRSVKEREPGCAHVANPKSGG